MSHTLTYHSSQNVQLCHNHIGKGMGPYAPTPARAHAHANATAPAAAHAHTNATALHLRYCAAGSTSVIDKMTILQRKSPSMDDLVRSTPPLHQDLLKELFDVCVWKQAGLV
ncbi:hypothetical protein O181_086311 [Austropuccinia psidii MF-1]|uniref:Uncharacterized protein n=1 Tax=Austropuccinia psidii MF-1 TaxID=1389203 RepID=A0A9Q3IKI9_9BASI|nr:hypothetical protein [Austropuccinia psidii MF-1]